MIWDGVVTGGGRRIQRMAMDGAMSNFSRIGGLKERSRSLARCSGMGLACTAHGRHLLHVFLHRCRKRLLIAGPNGCRVTNPPEAMDETALARNLTTTVDEARGVSDEALGAAGDDKQRRGPMYAILEGADDAGVNGWQRRITELSR